MANRIAGNVLIIDSGMGNSLVIPGSQVSKLLVNAFAVWHVDTTGAILLTGAHTSQDIVFKYDWVSLSSDSMGKVFVSNPSWFSFGQAQRMEDIKCPLVTAGTVFLYLI